MKTVENVSLVEDTAIIDIPEPKIEIETPGFIEHATSTHVTGWVSSEMLDGDFFVVIDNEKFLVHPKFNTRPDLIESNIDGKGFSFHYYTPKSNFELGVAGLINNEEVLLRVINSNIRHVEVSENSPHFTVIPTKDLPRLLSALDADTIQFHDAMQNYARYFACAGANIDCMFVDGTYGSVSTRYRITNIADGLRRLGVSVIHLRPDQHEAELISSINCRVAVFVRAPYDSFFQGIVERLKAKGTRIIYDIDDYVFDPDVVCQSDGVRFLSNDDMSMYLDGIDAYSRFITESDLVTAPTEYLAEAASKVSGKPSRVIINSIGKAYYDLYSSTSATKSHDRSEFIVGYYSGTKSHQKDFECVYAPLVKFLTKYPNARLRVVGKLDLFEFPNLAPLSSQIELVSFRPYHEMIEDLASVDVVLAPLEINDAFCEAKSELKFFEAALRHRPCIASATQTFRNAMKDGEFGALASTEEEWFAHLENFYLRPDERSQKASLAHKYALTHYSYKVAGLQANEVMFGGGERWQTANYIQRSTASSKYDSVPKNVAVLIPEIVPGGGGHRKIFRLCADWAASGKHITIYIQSQKNPRQVKDEIKKWFYDFECEVRVLRGRVQKHDIYVCTHWSTAYEIRNIEDASKVWYFIQDYEPMFEPVGTNYVKALRTYSLGFNMVCFGQWVADRIEREVAIKPKVIPFTLDRDIYKDSPKRNKTIDILFFARPSQPRRCFEIGVEALKLIHRANRAIRIGLFGEKEYGYLGFEYHNFGMISDLDKLSDLYRSARVGICFSTTNPSLVGYEMIACGLPIIDLRVPGSDLNFDGESFVNYANCDPQDIAKIIVSSLSYNKNKAASAKGLEFATHMEDDSSIARHFSSFISQGEKLS